VIGFNFRAIPHPVAAVDCWFEQFPFIIVKMFAEVLVDLVHRRHPEFKVGLHPIERGRSIP